MTFSNVTDLEAAFNSFSVAFDSVKSGELKKLLSSVVKGKINDSYLSEFLFDSVARKNGIASINASVVTKCKKRLENNAFYINDKKTTGLYFLIRSSIHNISTGFVFRYTRNNKVESVSLGLQDYKDLESARLKAIDLNKVLKSVEFKESVLNLKDFVEKRKSQENTDITTLFSEWLDKKSIRARTRRNYQSIFTKHIIPYFDKINLNKVNLDFIRVWLEKLEKKDYKTKHITFILCKNMFQFATHKQYITRNVFNDYCYKLDFKAYEPTSHEKFSEDKLLELLSFNRNGKKLRGVDFKDSLQGKILRFMIYMPFRISNVIMLEWQEVDLEKKLIKIKKEKMKNDRDFVIPINNEAYKILKDLENVKISQWVFDRRLDRIAHKRRLYKAVKEMLEYKKEYKAKNANIKRGITDMVAKKYNLNKQTLNCYTCEGLKDFKYYVEKLSYEKQENFQNVLENGLFAKLLKIRAHSLRGTFATLMNDNLHKIVNVGFNVNREIVGMCLAHDKKDIESVYSVSQMVDSKRLILDFWNNFLDNLQGKNEERIFGNHYANKVELRKVSGELFSLNNDSFLGGLDSSDLSSDDDTLSF